MQTIFNLEEAKNIPGDPIISSEKNYVNNPKMSSTCNLFCLLKTIREENQLSKPHVKRNIIILPNARVSFLMSLL